MSSENRNLIYSWGLCVEVQVSNAFYEYKQSIGLKPPHRWIFKYNDFLNMLQITISGLPR
jgi:hypothetical protein